MAAGGPRGRKSREAIFSQLSEGVEELRSRLGGLPSPIEAEDIWGDIWYQEAHNSTAIEGNTLVLREVELLLKEGRAVGNKQLAEYLEVRGYADAAEWVYQQGVAPGDWTTPRVPASVGDAQDRESSRGWEAPPLSGSLRRVRSPAATPLRSGPRRGRRTDRCGRPTKWTGGR